MVNSRSEGVRTGDVVTVLRKLGYSTTSKKKKGATLLYAHGDGTMVTVPFDPEAIMIPRWFEFVLRDIRMKEKDFWQLLKSS
jgi:predicted RNA binding protein YcfA (HicA-like mRNA interferase family)